MDLEATTTRRDAKKTVDRRSFLKKKPSVKPVGNSLKKEAVNKVRHTGENSQNHIDARVEATKK